MIRRDPIETKINHERWLVSYSDFITLLFAFFVVMYSVSQVSESKYKKLAETLSQTFDGKQLPAQQQDQEHGQQQNPQQISQNNIAELSQVQKELELALEGLVQENRVSLSGNEDWVEIDINASLIFASAKAELSDEAKTIFTQIADILAPHENAVAVSGHTDDMPISNQEFDNNWELSAARAVSVVNWLAFNGVKPERLSAVGYGEYRPVADNSTEQGRSTNRRVVLRVARDRAEQPAQRAQDVLPQGVTGISTEIRDTGAQDTTSSSQETPTIQPIELENGGLLFTSDPDSPRNKGG